MMPRSSETSICRGSRFIRQMQKHLTPDQRQPRDAGRLKAVDISVTEPNDHVFQQSRDRVRVKLTGGTLLRAFMVGTAIAIGWRLPFVWYWQVVSFLGIMLIVGLVVASFHRQS
jgi:hypothetical protein